MDNVNASGSTDRTKPARGESNDVGRIPNRSDARPAAGREVQLVQWAITLVLAVAALVWLWSFFGPAGMLAIGLVAVGLGFVVFIHELGHFAVAKWCDVYVETFSIGFGPAIPACSFRRGETLYKIAWFPLGGYVKMLGEGESNDEADDDPRSFKNKSVWQRMAIISAGVIMNVLFGLVCFIVVYMTHGVERPVGAVGAVDAGSPAWQKGVPSGVIIRQIGSITNPYFDDLKPTVAYSSKGEKLTFAYELPGQSDKVEKIQIEPRRDEKDPSPVIGIAPPYELKFYSKKPSSPATPVLPNSAADRASPPFQWGDSIVGATHPNHPDRFEPFNGDYSVFERRLQILAGKPMVVQVLRQGASMQDSPVDIHVPPAFHSVPGLRMRMGQITAVRENSPAAQSGIVARNPSHGVFEGDLIDQVEITEADHTKTRYVSSRSKSVPSDVMTIKDLDPVRLPYELEQWAAKQVPKNVKLIVLRGVERREVTLELAWDDRWKFDREVALSAFSPMPIGGLGLAYRIGTAIEAIEDKLPDGSNSPVKDMDLKRGDIIKAIRFQVSGKSDPRQSQPGRWFDLDSDEGVFVFMAMQLQSFPQVFLRVDHNGEIHEYEITAAPDKTWPLIDRGFEGMFFSYLKPATSLQRADGIGEAVGLGIQRTYRMIGQIYLSLRAMLTSRVSPTKNLGGPIMIAAMAYSFAGEDIFQFIFFLAVISINLAVINFLPIPILDGGYMVFLIYEKIRGIPASESVRSAATIVGLALILMLFAFTIWLDIGRFF